MPAQIAVIYYSSTGTVHKLAAAVAEGAEEVGAEVRLRRVQELAPEEAIAANPAWAAHRDKTQGVIPEASLEDLLWADGLAFGTPTRFGNPSAQLKQFIDATGGLWLAGKLADKVATSFTSAANRHGGMESTILALNNVFYSWGAIIVSPGYTDPAVFAAGGNPYGVAFDSGLDGANEMPGEILAAARYQGARLARLTERMVASR